MKQEVSVKATAQTKKAPQKRVRPEVIICQDVASLYWLIVNRRPVGKNNTFDRKEVDAWVEEMHQREGVTPAERFFCQVWGEAFTAKELSEAVTFAIEIMRQEGFIVWVSSAQEGTFLLDQDRCREFIHSQDERPAFLN